MTRSRGRSAPTPRRRVAGGAPGGARGADPVGQGQQRSHRRGPRDPARSAQSPLADPTIATRNRRRRRHGSGPPRPAIGPGRLTPTQWSRRPRRLHGARAAAQAKLRRPRSVTSATTAPHSPVAHRRVHESTDPRPTLAATAPRPTRAKTRCYPPRAAATAGPRSRRHPQRARTDRVQRRAARPDRAIGIATRARRDHQDRRQRPAPRPRRRSPPAASKRRILGLDVHPRRARTGAPHRATTRPRGSTRIHARDPSSHRREQASTVGSQRGVAGQRTRRPIR